MPEPAQQKLPTDPWDGLWPMPIWLRKAYLQKTQTGYTGALTFHFRDGRVQKVEERIIKGPQDF